MQASQLKTLMESIRITKSNAKSGASFSLPEGLTCPGETATCSSLCYAKKDAMAWPHVRGARAKNYAGVQELLRIRRELLSDALIAAIKKSKSSTIRIHDIGDFFSIAYVRAWVDVVRALPEVQFWTYTRSWRVPELVPILRALGCHQNVALWASADVECWALATAMVSMDPAWAGVAFMQTQDTADIARTVQARVGKRRFINFPLHARGKAQVDMFTDIRNCPAVMGVVPNLGPTNPMCVRCKLCLPKGA